MPNDGTQQRVLEYVQAHSGVTRGEIMRALGLREKQADNALWRLKDKGEISNTGPGRMSQWGVPKAARIPTPSVNSVWALADAEKRAA